MKCVRTRDFMVILYPRFRNSTTHLTLICILVYFCKNPWCKDECRGRFQLKLLLTSAFVKYAIFISELKKSIKNGQPSVKKMRNGTFLLEYNDVFLYQNTYLPCRFYMYVWFLDKNRNTYVVNNLEKVPLFNILPKPNLTDYSTQQILS